MDAKNHIVDKSRILVPKGTMEDFQRPNHPDFLTSEELKKAEYSGLRRNEMALTTEIWMLGDCVISITDEELSRNPQAINIAMEEVFALERVRPDTPQMRAFDIASGKG